MTDPNSERKIGVEEELMLIDPETGQLRAVSHRALAAHRARVDQAGGIAAEDDEPGDGNGNGFGPSAGLEQELFLLQLETGTTPCLDVGDLVANVRGCRRAAAESAEEAGAALVAVATPVLGGEDRDVTRKPRYQRIVDTFGLVSRRGSVCGMHLHVDVKGVEEAVRVMDRLRPWLPVLRAMSANSPYWFGEDTGYASWRSQVWGAWPTAGPSEPFVDEAGYRRATDELIACGAALDKGMLYLDARPSERYPTIELRVFDAVTEVDDIGLLAALSRALVDTAAREKTDDRPWRSDLVRAAHWLASRDGLTRELIDPSTATAAPARAVVEHAIEHCRDSLVAADDLERVRGGLEMLIARGTGSSRQRAAASRADPEGVPEAVLTDLRERFNASLGQPA